MNGRGFFLRGEEVIEITGTTHIRYVLEHPEIFGVKREDLIRKFGAMDELLGFEGEARQEILSGLFKEGWIRVRHKVGRREGFWIIEMDDWEQRKDSVKRFLRAMIADGSITEEDQVKLTVPDRKSLIRASEIIA